MKKKETILLHNRLDRGRHILLGGYEKKHRTLPQRVDQNLKIILQKDFSFHKSMFTNGFLVKHSKSCTRAFDSESGQTVRESLQTVIAQSLRQSTLIRILDYPITHPAHSLLQCAATAHAFMLYFLYAFAETHPILTAIYALLSCAKYAKFAAHQTLRRKTHLDCHEQTVACVSRIENDNAC